MQVEVTTWAAEFAQIGTEESESYGDGIAVADSRVEETMVRTLGLLSLMIGSALSVPAQQTKSPDPHPDEVLKAATEKNENIDLVYGRIKELKGGQKIVIQVDNAPDKTYNLADKDRTIKIAESLAIGDLVKIMESKDGKGVQIVRDVKAEQGQRSRTDKKN